MVTLLQRLCAREPRGTGQLFLKDGATLSRRVKGHGAGQQAQALLTSAAHKLARSTLPFVSATPAPTRPQSSLGCGMRSRGLLPSAALLPPPPLPLLGPAVHKARRRSAGRTLGPRRHPARGSGGARPHPARGSLGFLSPRRGCCHQDRGLGPSADSQPRTSPQHPRRPWPGPAAWPRPSRAPSPRPRLAA